jgi:uncharacterized protein
MGRRQSLIKQLKEFKNKLEEIISVNRILFFGSMSRGKAKKDSDVDLIIVSKDFKGKSFRRRAIGFYDYWDLDYPVDFLCYTPEEFNKLKKQVSIVSEAIKKGVEV